MPLIQIVSGIKPAKSASLQNQPKCNTVAKKWQIELFLKRDLVFYKMQAILD